jgi:DtxR family Mn-dependent transcriptional regulator
MLTPAIEDYLKAIYDLAGEDGRASTSGLARRLDVAPASVTGMLRKLAERRPAWVVYQKSRGATLTPEGRLRALEILRHHRLIECFLHDALGYSWDEVHAEADRLEHAISETLEDRMASRLGDPLADPHGHPIPRKDGTLPPRREIPLADLPVGSSAVVSRVSDGDPALLRYLKGRGIVPNASLAVVDLGPLGDPLMVRVGDASETCALSRKVAGEVHVHDGPRERGQGT